VDQYERDKAFVDYMMKDLILAIGLPADLHPLAVLARDELKAPARARQGLRMAINDIVEDTSDRDPESVRLTDQQLRLVGASTLTEVRARYSRGLARVEKRGSIKSEVELYLVKGVLDGAADALSPERRDRLQSILSIYEKSLG